MHFKPSFIVGLAYMLAESDRRAVNEQIGFGSSSEVCGAQSPLSKRKLLHGKCITKSTKWKFSGYECHFHRTLNLFGRFDVHALDI